jgi:hypothetical protein
MLTSVIFHPAICIKRLISRCCIPNVSATEIIDFLARKFTIDSTTVILTPFLSEDRHWQQHREKMT